MIDLSTPLAEATGRVLADLGAEVIKVEPPGGCESRFAPPFADGGGASGDPEGSLYWRSWGLGKKSVVLDLDDAADRAKLLELARGADVWIESAARILAYLARSREDSTEIPADHWALLATEKMLSVETSNELPVSRELLISHAIQISGAILQDQIEDPERPVAQGEDPW